MMVAAFELSVSRIMDARLVPDLTGSDSILLSSPTPSKVDQLKLELISAADNNDESSGISICNKLEKLNLSKEHLESTRIGGIVNEVRKRVAESMPKFSIACRQLIKAWRKQTDTYTRSTSSCGGSNGVTPSMMSMSPALRRLVTPQTPHRLADGTITKSQTSSPRVPAASLNGVHGSSVDLVSQAAEKIQLQNGTDSMKIALKRKMEINISPTEAPSAFKRSKSALIPQQTIQPSQLSLSAVRQNAQSTTELVAQLSENLPSHLTPDLNQFHIPESNSTSPNVITKVTIPQPIITQDERKEKRKYTKRAPRFFKDGGEPSTSVDVEEDEVVIPNSRTERKQQPKTSTIVSDGKKVDWFASIPSIDELRKRAEEKKITESSQNIRSPYVINVNNHDLICLPFVDVG